MKPDLNLSVPKPCGEKWQNFTPTALGGFCSSCSKVVVDFTKMKDDEIIAFFEDRPAHACGRFRPDQLKTYNSLQQIQIYPGLRLLRAGLLALFVMVMSRQSYAQEGSAKSKIETVLFPDERVEVKAPSNDFQVKGIVKDEDGLPLPGCNVYLQGGTNGTVTDVDGKFEFPVNLKEGDRLIFSFIGFQSKEYVIKKKDSEGVEIDMMIEIAMCLRYDITGEVAINDVYTSKTGLRLWWSNFKKHF